MNSVAFKLRPHQRLVNEGLTRFTSLVMHRRAGKSVYCIMKAISAASGHATGGGRYHYVGPSIRQTKAIAWAYAQQALRGIPGVTFNQSELKITWPNGTTLELLGVENIDALRGRYSNGIILDEAQLMPQSHWAYVLRPLLSDRKGWAIIAGTPAGRHNLLGWAHRQDDWAHFVLPYTETDAIDPSELADMRKQMSPEAWAQEMECSFTAALQGAFWSRAVDELERSGRLTTVKADKMLQTTVALDLGHNDLMPCIWHQKAGTEHRIIFGKAYRFTSLVDMIADWRETCPAVDHVILPHDAAVHSLNDRKTRQDIFMEMGYQTSIAPKLPLFEGIEIVRNALGNTWIDRDDAYEVFEAAGGYRSEENEERQVFAVSPLHSWESHWADALRYLFTGNHNRTVWDAPRPKLRATI